MYYDISLLLPSLKANATRVSTLAKNGGWKLRGLISGWKWVGGLQKADGSYYGSSSVG